MFNISIKENVRLGNPKATDEEIEVALKKANAYDFLMKHDDGINLNAGAAGNQISGGQKQRVAIARAFIKKPNILLFDEATSALDTNSEALVQQSIENLSMNENKMTIIVIAHRLSTVINAQRIVVMKEGSIIEEGNHS